MAAKKKTSKKASKKAASKPKPKPSKQLELFEDDDRIDEFPDGQNGPYVCEEILDIGANDGEIVSVAEFRAVMGFVAHQAVLLTVARIDAAVRGGSTLDDALLEVLEVAEKNYTKPTRSA
jgi:hypothetical protein